MPTDMQGYLDGLPEDRRHKIDERSKELVSHQTSVDLLRRLLSGGSWTTSGVYDDPVCYFCQEDWIDMDHERHKPDCPYVAAKAFLDSIDAAG